VCSPLCTATAENQCHLWTLLSGPKIFTGSKSLYTAHRNCYKKQKQFVKTPHILSFNQFYKHQPEYPT
jgi:hypothetical protein